MMDFIDKVALIYLKDSKILSTRSKGKSKYYIPGGKREQGESDIETLCREIKEELTVNILLETVNYFGIFIAQADGKPDGLNIKMICYTAEFDGILMPDSEIEEIVWLTFSDIDMVSAVDKLVFENLHKKGFLD